MTSTSKAIKNALRVSIDTEIDAMISKQARTLDHNISRLQLAAVGVHVFM
jgi:post-segregation antitoxin (ccd killing protein)